VLHVKTKESRT